MRWEIEPIPDDGVLYHRIHKQFIREDEISPSAFRKLHLCVDWAKYSTPEQSRGRARVPADNGIARFVAGEVRALPQQSVVHSPLEINHAHSEVVGEKTEKVRLLLSRLARFVIRLEAPLF